MQELKSYKFRRQKVPKMIPFIFYENTELCVKFLDWSIIPEKLQGHIRNFEKICINVY